MQLIRLLASFSLLAISGTAAAAPVPNFRLLDQNGVSRELYRYGDRKAIVLFVRAGDPSAFDKSVPALRVLLGRFASRNAAFLMIDAASGNGDVLEIPILRDEGQLVVRSLGITQAEEVLLIDPRRWRIVYRGSLGGGLDDALDALLHGKSAVTETTESGARPRIYASRENVTYTGEAASILKAKCAQCHQDESGPAPLTSYEKARGWAPMIRETLLTRRMPPWSADPRYGTFSNDLSLSGEELRILVDWIDAGAKRGEGRDPLVVAGAVRPREWPLGQPDMILAMTEPAVVPASGTFSWQYFHLMGPLKDDLWIRALDIQPGNRRVVHHVFLMDFPEPFWEHKDYGGNWRSGNMMAIRPRGVVPLGNWTPGRAPSALPAGVAVRVPKGHYLALEIHYTPAGKEEVDRTKVGVYLHKGEAPAKELKTRRLNKTNLVIPAGEGEVIVAPQFVTKFAKDSYLVSLRPHMHARGARMRAIALYPGGRRETLLSVPAYNFDWQHLYNYVKPKFIPAGTSIFADGAYDNSRMNPANPDSSQRVGWGLRSSDEMFVFWVHFFEAPSSGRGWFTARP